jgi:Cu/Ag efflux pump CusA
MSIRVIKTWTVKYRFQTVPGGDEILSLEGHVLQYQNRCKPVALIKFDLHSMM